MTTGADGTFCFRFTPPRGNWFELQFAADGRIPLYARFEEFEVGTDLDLGDVALAHGCVVHGVIVDTRGVPQVGVELDLYLRSSSSSAAGKTRPVQVARTRTGPAGWFAFAQTFLSGTWQLSTRNRQKLEPFAVEIGERQTDADVRVVVMRAEDVEYISGSVFDESGAGIAAARVTTRMHTMDSMWATVAADGSFRLERRVQDPPGPFELVASASGFDSQKRTGIAWGARDVVFVLPQGASVTLIVRDGAGQPVERYGVRDVTRGRMPYLLEHMGRHPHGELELSGLRSGERAVIVVPLQGGLLPSAVTSFEVQSGAHSQVEVRVYAPEHRVVEVRRADGTGIAGARVELLEPGRCAVRVSTFAKRWDTSPGIRDLRTMARLLAEGHTADDGDVALSGPPDPSLAVRVSGPGFRPVVVADQTWRTDRGPLRVTVATGATLTGRLLPEATIRGYWRAAAIGVEPGSTPLRAPHLELTSSIDGHDQSYPPSNLGQVFVQRDGTFTVAGVPPGTWHVSLVHLARSEGGRGQSKTQHLGTVADLRDGEMRRFDVTLGSRQPAFLHGVVQVDGQPLLSGWVHLSRVDDGATGAITVRTDALGQFDAELEPGSWHLEVAFDAYGERLPVPGEFALERGQQRREVVKLRTGQLKVRLVRGDGETPVAGVRVLVELAGSRGHRWLPATDAEGVSRLDRLPLQVLRLSCRPAHLTPDAAWTAWRRAHPGNWRDALVGLGEVDLGASSGLQKRTVPDYAGF